MRVSNAHTRAGYEKRVFLELIFILGRTLRIPPFFFDIFQRLQCLKSFLNHVTKTDSSAFYVANRPIL
eukprot:UN17014